MTWQTTIFLAVLLFLMALPWHLPDAGNPINPTPKSILLTGVVTLCQHCRSYVSRRFNPKPHLAAAVIEVASRLNAGSDSESAWLKTLPRHGFDPPASANTSDLEAAIKLHLTSWERNSLTGLLAAVRFSQAVGAPLSQVLTGCADSLTEASRAARARKVALTAPKTSALILGFLPLGGIALGILLGANPLAAIFSGGLATISALGGVIALLAGMFWMFRLVSQAEKA